jgi:hypothetical protein
MPDMARQDFPFETRRWRTNRIRSVNAGTTLTSAVIERDRRAGNYLSRQAVARKWHHPAPFLCCSFW